MARSGNIGQLTAESAVIFDEMDGDPPEVPA
jgi:hypothetical protein